MNYNSIRDIQKEWDDIAKKASIIDKLTLRAGTYFSNTTLMLYKRHIIKRLKPAGNGVWLDVCCGAGTNSIILASKHSCKIVSFDISIEALRRGQKIKKYFGINNIDFINADVFHLPFRDAIFDGSIATQSFSYYILEEQKTLLQNLSLCLKQDALFILSDATKGSSTYHLIEPSTYISLLRDLGFYIIEKEEWGHELYQFLNKIRSKIVSMMQKKEITSILIYKFVSLYTSIVFRVTMIENRFRKKGGFLFYIIAKKRVKRTMLMV